MTGQGDSLKRAKNFGQKFGIWPRLGPKDCDSEVVLNKGEFKGFLHQKNFQQENFLVVSFLGFTNRQLNVESVEKRWQKKRKWIACLMNDCTKKQEEEDVLSKSVFFLNKEQIHITESQIVWLVFFSHEFFFCFKENLYSSKPFLLLFSSLSQWVLFSLPSKKLSQLSVFFIFFLRHPCTRPVFRIEKTLLECF